MLTQARSQGACGGWDTPSNLAKGPLLATKWAKNWGFCRRVGGGEVQKVNFWGPKGPLLGDSAPPQIQCFIFLVITHLKRGFFVLCLFVCFFISTVGQNDSS